MEPPGSSVVRWQLSDRSAHTGALKMPRILGANMATFRKTAAIASSPILCFSHLRWNFVYQRPQHLLSRAAEDHEVFFFEEPVFAEGIQPFVQRTRSNEGITVLVPMLPKAMNGPQITRALRSLVDTVVGGIGRADLVLWYYTPMALPFSRHLAACLRVYDNMDELSAFSGAPPRLIAMERELFRKVDVVFTGGQSLYESKKKRHPNVHACPSSIDASHFGTSREASQREPHDQASISGPRVGFFGVIDERMDLDFLAKAAAIRPQWQFVMIGPVVKIDPSSLPQRPNIHWLGPKTYAQLPAYLAGWDLGFMPFALNEATRFISPTKTPEFLAAGIPLVSTAIADVIRPYGELGLVEIAHSPEDLVNLGTALLARPTLPWLTRVDQHLAGMSWDLTWASMHRIMLKSQPQAGRTVSAWDEAVSHV
ncbi:glycosyltransferase family 1 protein [Neorhizobium sp. T786]|uniref:glycosyltransferase family 1 protein n=1 Tax=Pseudorhizobium xiangyangii TaxID=2883104 RepID=UPI001D0003C8|nr:glycosyltransferase family 1 protein [Neorhizobium xiangyangii]MCB5203735.1 glycosyltransferase family 1 protein [Neorhizobium xiangyangii]